MVERWESDWLTDWHDWHDFMRETLPSFSDWPKIRTKIVSLKKFGRHVCTTWVDHFRHRLIIVRLESVRQIILFPPSYESRHFPFSHPSNLPDCSLFSQWETYLTRREWKSSLQKWSRVWDTRDFLWGRHKLKDRKENEGESIGIISIISIILIILFPLSSHLNPLPLSSILSSTAILMRRKQGN